MMEKVFFIVGNGFDLFHGLPTSYGNFKKELLKMQKELIINQVVEQSRIVELCNQIEQLKIDLNISKDELKKVISDNNMDDWICNQVYRRFLSILYAKTYSREFLEERGYSVSEEVEVDYEKIQEIIRIFEKIIDEINRIFNCCKQPKKICVTNNEDYDQMNEIDRIEFILRTFEDIEFIMRKNGKDAWGCFEESCGIIDFQFFLNQIPDDLFLDKEGDLDEYLRDDLLSPMITPYVRVLESLPKYFEKWIESIDVSKATSKKEIKEFFEMYHVECLNFNYTDTVESVYGQSCIFHIHGRQGEKIYVGHGNKEIFVDESNIVLEDAMLKIRNTLKKDIQMILKNNEKDFFSRIDSSIDKIFVFGFSFSKVDLPYIKRINEQLPKSHWYVQSYLSKEFLEFKKTLLDIGVEESNIHHWYV